MIRLLPFILIPVLIIAGLGYWRFGATKQQAQESILQESSLMEVPKTLPDATLEDRVQNIEDAIKKLVPQINSLKSSGSQAQEQTSISTQVTALETAITELKTRVSSLEKAAPVPAAASKYPLYIPLGAGGGPWTDQAWNTLTEYQASINPDNYSGYSSMQLEVNFRLSESAGTGSVRLYNVTDSGAISSQADTTSTSFGLQTSGTFKLPGGQKTYTIQVKSSEGKTLFIQSARIKVNF